MAPELFKYQDSFGAAPCYQQEKPKRQYTQQISVLSMQPNAGDSCSQFCASKFNDDQLLATLSRKGWSLLGSLTLLWALLPVVLCINKRLGSFQAFT